MEFFRTLRDQLQADRDTRPEALAKLAGASFDLASTTEEIGSIPDAIRSYSESLAILERLARDHPGVAEYQSDLAASHQRDRPTCSSLTGRPAEALDVVPPGDHDPRAAGPRPSRVLPYQNELAQSHHNIGVLLTDTGHPAEAMDAFRRAVAILEPMARDHPTTAEYQYALADGARQHRLPAPRHGPPGRGAGVAPSGAGDPPADRPGRPRATSGYESDLGVDPPGHRQSAERHGPSGRGAGRRTVGRWRSASGWPATTPPSPSTRAIWALCLRQHRRLPARHGPSGRGAGRVPAVAGDPRAAGPRPSRRRPVPAR